MVIPLLEDKEFMDNLDDILDVEGIDGVSFGPTDYALSIGLNLLYDFNHPKLVGTFEAVVDGAKKRNLPILSAINPPTLEQSQKLSDMGVKFQLFGSDIAIMAEAFQNLMTAVAPEVKAD